MKSLANLLTGAGVGAALMYAFDPDRGNRRRTRMRDQMRRAATKSSRGADATLRDVEHRLRGTLAEFRGVFRRDTASDDVLVERVRSKIGRYVRHPAAIEVTAHNRLITLRGPVLSDEVDELLDAVGSVRGVRDVVNQLELHDSPGNVAGLQGVGERWGEPWPLMQTCWSPAARVAAGAAGAMLMLNCATRRNPLATMGGIAGFGLLLRAMTNLETKRLLGLHGRRGIDIRKTITIHRPIEEVYRMLADPTRYPQFTGLVSSVRDEGNGVLRKTIVGPFGREVVIRERITSKIPNEVVAVRSEADSPIRYAGRACFVPLDDHTTKVDIQATYNPPGGVVSHGAAWLAGVDPKSLMDDILARAKSYLETGIQPHDAVSQAAAEHRPQPI